MGFLTERTKERDRKKSPSRVGTNFKKKGLKTYSIKEARI